MTDPTARPQRVLFIRTGNTARSQMAQVLLAHHGGDRFEVTSAGLEPGTVHPLTLKVLQERGLPTDHLEAKSTTPSWDSTSRTSSPCVTALSRIVRSSRSLCGVRPGLSMIRPPRPAVTRIS